MNILSSIFNLLFPKVCPICGKALIDGELMLCLQCNTLMPRTNLHLTPEASISRRILTPVRGVRFASLFYYKKETPYALLIQHSKYHGRPHIDRNLARMFAAELLPSGFFCGIDMILPVPVYFLKKAKRGFNQAEFIAQGISEVTGIPVSDNLKAVRHHTTQTRLTAADRRNISSGIFSCAHPHELTNKHILIVDDVLTTGATLLSCAAAVRSAAPSTSISFLTLSTTI